MQRCLHFFHSVPHCPRLFKKSATARPLEIGSCCYTSPVEQIEARTTSIPRRISDEFETERLRDKRPLRAAWAFADPFHRFEGKGSRLHSLCGFGVLTVGDV